MERGIRREREEERAYIRLVFTNGKSLLDPLITSTDLFPKRVNPIQRTSPSVLKYVKTCCIWDNAEKFELFCLEE